MNAVKIPLGRLPADISALLCAYTAEKLGCATISHGFSAMKRHAEVINDPRAALRRSTSPRSFSPASLYALDVETVFRVKRLRRRRGWPRDMMGSVDVAVARLAVHEFCGNAEKMGSGLYHLKSDFLPFRWVYICVFCKYVVKAAPKISPSMRMLDASGPMAPALYHNEETHDNARIVPVEARPAASSTNLASITEQLNQQNAAVHEEFNRLQTQLAENQSAVLARLDSLPILTVANPAASQYGSIACVRYVQDAAVLAYPIVRWIDPNDGCTKHKALGSYSPVGIQEEFNLMPSEKASGGD
ncbi:hypothetical protein DFH06DRAFT_1320948 [Mycena polygramma]|nr:hypothetical protein DFH06DRAFT_1320948 [Mycena polygramma]